MAEDDEYIVSDLSLNECEWYNQSLLGCDQSHDLSTLNNDQSTLDG